MNSPSRALFLFSLIIPIASGIGSESSDTNSPQEFFHWRAGPPLVQPSRAGGHDWHAIKDPSIVRHEGKWHLFCTVRGTERSHAIVYRSFADWEDADAAEEQVLSCHAGYFCAPQVFYFEPQEKWYLICQGSREDWDPAYGAAFSTNSDIADPNGWSPLEPLGARRTSEDKAGLDFWVICDADKAHLFFTTLNGQLWREETLLENFPHGWSEPVLALEGDFFEACHIYRLGGSGPYLAFIEALDGHGFRYFKAYTTAHLSGEWKPLAAEKDHSFASMANVDQAGGHWTDAVSHGELIRNGSNQELEVDPDNLQLLIQGVLDADRTGDKYGEIPWRLGLLTRQPELWKNIPKRD